MAIAAGEETSQTGGAGGYTAASPSSSPAGAEGCSADQSTPTDGTQASSSAPPSTGRCDNCNKLIQKCLVCTRCKKVAYCSQLCQKDDWPYHKQGCKTSTQRQADQDLKAEKEAAAREAAKQQVKWCWKSSLLFKRVKDGDSALTELDLTLCEVGDEVISQFAASFSKVPQLESLILEDNDIGLFGAEALAPSFVHLASLKTLNLDNNRLEVGGIAALAEGLKSMPSLTELSAVNNLLGPKAASLAAQLMLTLPSLQTLKLRENFIREEGIQLFADAFLESTRDFDQDRLSLDFSNNDLRVAGAKAVASLIKGCKGIASLELAENKIHDFGAMKIADALSENTTLTYLGISFNLISNPGAGALAKAISKNRGLQTLELSGEGREKSISDEGAVALAAALRENSVLRDLDLSCNTLSNTGANALLDAMANNKTLTSLTLEGNDIEIATLERLAQALARNT